MRVSFHESINDLKNEMIKMGSMVENGIHQCIEALINQDLDLAENIITKDDLIDDYQNTIEEKCIKLIALQQPVATDLRTIMVISKIVTDLERIGDHVVNIAEMVLKIGETELLKPLANIPKMKDIVTRRLRESLKAFVNQDIILAKKIAREDDEIDELDQQILRELLCFIIDNPARIKQATFIMFISRFLERIGDHSTNLCERTIYMVSGKRETY